MPDLSQYLAQADHVLMALGLAIVLAWFARTFVRGTWRLDWRIPAPPSNTLSGMDLMLGAFAYVVFAQVGVSFARLILGNDVATTTAPIEGSATLSPSVVLGGSIGTCATIVALMLIGRSRFKSGLVGWGVHVSRFWRQILIALCLTTVAMPICYGILGATQWIMEHVFQLNPQEHGAIELLRDRSGPAWVLGLTAINAILIVPIAEELLFRGLMLPALARLMDSPTAGLIVSSVLFGMIHFSVGKSVPALIVFGIILGATYLRTRSLVTVTLVHSLFNAKTIFWIVQGPAA